MGEKKVTTMVLEVDLNCEKCRKKVKKILCKIPQIHDQVWDEKKNTVTIKVVCCSPEKIKEKIICKAGDSIKSIEIVVPEKPKPPPAEKPKPSPAPKQAEPPPPPSMAPPFPVGRPPFYHFIPEQPPWLPYPIWVSGGHGGGHGIPGYGGGPPSHFYEYDGYMGRTVYESYGGGRGYCINRCDNYFSEENPQDCCVM